jgi:hypothetical protein
MMMAKRAIEVEKAGSRSDAWRRLRAAETIGLRYMHH